MYNLSCRLPIQREPWNIPLEERRQRLFASKQSGKQIALMVYHHADTSTFRYRCYNVMQALERAETWDSIYFFVNELPEVFALLKNVSLLIFVRVKWEHLMDDVVEKAHQLKIPVLYDIDDLVCNIQYLKTVTNTLNVHFGGEADYDFWFAYISRLEYMASKADGFITTNDYLGNMLSERFGKPYQVIQNSLNNEQLCASDICRRAKRQVKNAKPFTIGYFSGTPSHINDFKTVCPEIISFLHDFPDTNLQVVGFMEFPQEMQSYIKKKRVQYLPLVDFVELQRLVAQVDVNIVPLVQNVFTNCKSELKFFEASVVDTVTIAAPVYTYQYSIQNGETGFLCNPGEWYERLQQIYQHPKLGQQVAEKAKDYCLNVYTGDIFLRQICTAYDQFAEK